MQHAQLIAAELRQAADLLDRFLNDPAHLAAIEAAATLLAGAMRNGRKIISCGNGGSHCDAMHFADDLTGRYRDNRRAVPSIAVFEVSHLSFTGNVFGF